MEELFLHIEKLLANYDYAIVPHFGGFVVQRKSARLLDERIIAPRANIGFNPLMNTVDGLLTLEIARHQGITYRQAGEFIEQKVEQYKKMLGYEKCLPFGNLGYFSRQADNSLLFQANEQLDFLPFNFGKKDIYFQSSKPAIELQSNNFDFGKVLRYAAAITLIGGLSILTPDNSNFKNSTNQANILNINFKNNPLDNEQTLVSDEFTQTETDNNECFVDQSAKYEVIIACLKSRDAAEKYCNKLKNSDFPDTHIFATSNLYYVSARAFGDKAEAVEFMQNLRQTSDNFTSAWVLCQ